MCAGVPAVVVACMPACMMAGPAFEIRLPPACAAVLPACTACSLPRLRDVLLFHMSDPAQVPEPILESDLVSSSSTRTQGSNAWLTFASLASTTCQLPTNCASYLYLYLWLRRPHSQLFPHPCRCCRSRASPSPRCCQAPTSAVGRGLGLPGGRSQ